MFRGGWHRRSGTIAALLAVSLLSQARSATADVISLADQVRGTELSQEQCDALPRAVFVAVAGREFCMRYYLSFAGGENKAALVFLQGDRLGQLDRLTGEFSPGPRDKDTDTRDFNRIATLLSKEAGVPAIYLARPGLDGSSGHHRIRHSRLELGVVSAALDAIKQRHGFVGFHMLGQSGGSTLIGGLLGMRGDIGCAVLGSGALSYSRVKKSIDPAEDIFNPADRIDAIAKRQGLRVLLVTDPADRKVPEPVQADFARRLKLAGGHVEQFMVRATDEDRHATLPYARTVMAGCLRGMRSEDIATQLASQIETALADRTKALSQTR